MNVLSLFDGCSCGQQALDRLGIKVDNYFASEIDKYAIQVTMANYPNTIQLGSVVNVDVKTICLSEVYDYICHKYFNNDIYGLQSIVPKWEMLHRINEKQTFTAYFGTQVKDEISKTQSDTAISINDRIWFWKCEMGDNEGVYDIIRSGSRGNVANKIDVGELCKHSFWWNGNGQHQPRNSQKGFIGSNGIEEISKNKTEVEGNSNQTIFNNRGEGTPKNESHRTIQRPNKETELFERDSINRYGEKVFEEKTNRIIKEGEKIFNNEGTLQANNENDGISIDNRVLLSIYNEVQVTIIECEWGIIVFKGSIKTTFGGSPCQSFSFAGKRKGMATKCETEILTLETYLQLKNDGFEFEGQSYLFWEYMRILTELREINPNIEFLLENVEMGEKWEKVLSRAIGVNGIHINSALVSAQNRKRIYWTNIGMIPGGLFGDLVSIIEQPKDKGILLKDILETDVPEKFYLSEKMIKWLTKHSEKRGSEFKKLDGNQKASCLTTTEAKQNLSNDYICIASRGRNPENPKSREPGLNTEQMLEPRYDGKSNCITSVSKDNLVMQLNGNIESGGKQPYQQNRVYDTNGISPALMAQMSCGTHAILEKGTKIRRLTPTECERLQTVPDGYTSPVSDTQRYRMLGNGWTVSVVSHIFSYLPKEYFEIK